MPENNKPSDRDKASESSIDEEHELSIVRIGIGRRFESEMKNFADVDLMGTLFMTFESEEIMDAEELGAFLGLLTMAYSVGFHLNVFHMAGNKIVGPFNEETIDPLFQFVEEGYVRPLGIKQISFKSPLEIAFVGFSSALIMAAIISGGSVELKALGIFTMKARFQSLGDGIMKIRKAFNKDINPRKISGEKGRNYPNKKKDAS